MKSLPEQMRELVEFDELAEMDEGMWERVKHLVRSRVAERSNIVIVSFPRRRENLFNREW